jgi:hypothetical protein
MAYDDLEVYTDNGLLIKGDNALSLLVNNSSTTVKDLLHDCFEKNVEKLPKLDLGMGFNLFPIKRTQKMVTLTQTFKKGNIIETVNGLSHIEKLTIDVRYIETLKPNAFL